jgi:ornithine cyclodeaminase/alanine dehydrogenase-like protein (mu-crystallin family)
MSLSTKFLRKGCKAFSVTKLIVIGAGVRARKQVEQARGVRVSRRRQLNSFLG